MVARLARMRRLQRALGTRFEGVRRELLACLAAPAHRARVRCVVARKPK